MRVDALPEEALLITAVERAARVLRAGGPLPPRSEDVLRFAVRDELHGLGMTDVAHEAASITGGWNPLPGRLDLHAPMQRPLRWAAEVKVWDIDQQLWDALKVASGIAHGDLQTGYLLAAACPTAFAHTGGRELFAAAGSDHQGTPASQRARMAAPPHGRRRAADRDPRADHHAGVDRRVVLVRAPSAARSRRGRSGRRVAWFPGRWPEGVHAEAAVRAAGGLSARGERDALGVSVPARWNDEWWQRTLDAGVSAEQFEAVYGLLLTRGWTDPDVRARVRPPDGAAPAWWT